jgi:hypothetical protein
MLSISESSPKAAKLYRISGFNLDRSEVRLHAHAPYHPHACDVLHGHEEHVLRWEKAAQWGLI